MYKTKLVVIFGVCLGVTAIGVTIYLASKSNNDSSSIGGKDNKQNVPLVKKSEPAKGKTVEDLNKHENEPISNEEDLTFIVEEPENEKVESQEVKSGSTTLIDQNPESSNPELVNVENPELINPELANVENAVDPEPVNVENPELAIETQKPTRGGLFSIISGTWNYFTYYFWYDHTAPLNSSDDIVITSNRITFEDKQEKDTFKIVLSQNKEVEYKTLENLFTAAVILTKINGSLAKTVIVSDYKNGKKVFGDSLFKVYLFELIKKETSGSLPRFIFSYDKYIKNNMMNFPFVQREDKTIYLVDDRQKFLMTNNTNFVDAVYNFSKDKLNEEMRNAIIEKTLWVSNDEKVSPLEFICGKVISDIAE